MQYFFLILIVFSLNFLIFYNFPIFEKNLYIFDKPDNNLKKHKHPVSLLGGLIILVNLYFITFLLKIFELDNSIFDNNFIFIIILLSSLFYLIGFIDDLKNLKPNLKLMFLIFSIVLVIYLFPEIKLNLIKITFLEKHYFFHYSFFFIALSFALLANAMNMFDGINLQLILYTVFVFILFILKGFIPIFFILLSICFIFLGILNYKNKIFLGDGGAYIISAIFGSTFIYQYKSFDNFFYGDEVFIILMIPAIDMLRLFILRLVKKKHPFEGDLNHLHHIVLKKTKNNNLTIMITITLSIIPTLLLFLKIKTFLILLLVLTIYVSLILYCRPR